MCCVQCPGSDFIKATEVYSSVVVVYRLLRKTGHKCAFGLLEPSM